MITIASLLKTGFVKTELASSNGPEAVKEVVGLLAGSPEVLDFEALREGVGHSTSCLADPDAPYALCVPHVRTKAVSSMVMAVGRSLQGIRFEGCQVPVRYIFCIGLPTAMNAEYLRVMGALMRILRDPEGETRLCAAKTETEFVQVISQLEARL